MNPPPPPLKKSTPLFGQQPPPPLAPQNTKSFKPPFCSNPLFMRKVLVSPPSFFIKSCFMKPIVRYKIRVFHQDLTTTGSSNKKV